MDVYIIGQMIKEFRTRKLISQEDLCDGLCAVSTLSRIENAQANPSKKLAEALLSRMGVSTNIANMPTTINDMKRWFLERQINESILKNDFEFSESLKEYKKLGEMGFLEEQTFWFYTGIYKFHEKEDFGIALADFNKALLLSLPGYKNVADLKNRLLSKMELKILNNIALTNYSLGNEKEAIEVLEFLKDYFTKKLLDDSQVASGLPLILYNLTNWKFHAGFQEDALRLAEEGIRVCSKYGRLTYYPYHIFNKGWILCKSGQIEQGKIHLQNALANFAYLKRFAEVKDDIPVINSEFNLSFKTEDFLLLNG